MKRSAYEVLGQITQVGLNVLIPILGCMLFGSWLDKKLAARGVFLLIFTLVGVAAGIGNIVRLGKKL